jgi:hypothetical protein
MLKFFLSALFFLFILSGAAIAEETPASAETEEEEEIFVIDDVEVRGKLSGDSLGKTEIPRELLKNMPKGDGSVTDLLRAAPSVQYDMEYRSSATGGEITPAKVSISGGRPYENLFLLDGMSNSNMLDPEISSTVSTENVGGGSQKFFIDSWLIEDMTLYDSNISAAYGDFTGGVVEARTKNPSDKFGGKFSYRTTRSGWSHFYVDERDREYFNKSDQPLQQPNFKKDIYTASLSIPINADTGILASYNRTQSVIPLGYFRDYKDTIRLSETYFLKAVHNINGSSYIDLSTAYSPYKGKYFLHDTVDGEYEINMGGYAAIGNYHLETAGGGEVKIHADYSFQENSRTGSKDYHFRWISSKFKPWGAGADEDFTKSSDSFEGGPGNIEKENGAASLKFDHSLGALTFLGEHKLSYGAAYSYIFGRHHRPTDYFSFYGETESLSVNCNGDTFSCIDGDQYFDTRVRYPASDVSAYINEYAVYLEDEWKFSRLKLRAGGRVSGDDYMNNINFAPRTQLQWDIFNDNATLLTIGYSRYYSANLLANKLREGIAGEIKNVRWTYNNKLTPWMPTDDISVSIYNFRELKTPHTDEYTAALEQKIFGSILGLKYMERHARDEFAIDDRIAEKDGKYHQRLNNSGSSDYRSAQLKWSRAWENHYIIFNATWSESNTSHNKYDDILGLDTPEAEVVFNGRTIKRKDLPKDNFNKPYIFNLGYVGRYFNHLTVSGILNYSTPYKKLYSEGDENIGMLNDSNLVSAYGIAEIGDIITLDCSLSWEQKIYNDHKIILTLEVLNLLDSKNKIGEAHRIYYKGDYSYGKYQMGRQFWAGLAYEF